MGGSNFEPAFLKGLSKLRARGVTGIAFGVLPALRMTRSAGVVALRENGRTGSGRGAERLRSGLELAEAH